MTSGKGSPSNQWQFRAFISYSHADKTYASKLHRRLETYRLPKRLRENAPALQSNGRLGKVFRDREDFAASEDLSESIKSAIAVSQALIVLCSPRSKWSRWVEDEISLFRQLHPDRPILAAIIDGEPDDVIPDLLRQGREPLAADLRKHGDGARLGFLKIVAGIAGAPLDALINRDAQRRVATVTVITVIASTVALIMALMTTVALNARDLAKTAQQQAEAQARATEALNDYLVGDFRDVLIERVPLEIAAEFYPEVLAYCRKQLDGVRLSQTGRENCVEYMWFMGTDLISLDRTDEAFDYLEAATEITEDWLSASPQDATRILDHAKSLNRLGFYHYGQNDHAASMQAFQTAIELIDTVDADTKKRPEWLRHSAYLRASMTRTILESALNPNDAMPYIIESVEHTLSLVQATDRDLSAFSDLGFHMQWLATAQLSIGQFELAAKNSEIAISLVDLLTTREPENLFFLEQKMQIYDRHARILETADPSADISKYKLIASSLSTFLQSQDPDNVDYKITDN